MEDAIRGGHVRGQAIDAFRYAEQDFLNLWFAAGDPAAPHVPHVPPVPPATPAPAPRPPHKVSDAGGSGGGGGGAAASRVVRYVHSTHSVRMLPHTYNAQKYIKHHNEGLWTLQVRSFPTAGDQA